MISMTQLGTMTNWLLLHSGWRLTSEEQENIEPDPANRKLHLGRLKQPISGIIFLLFLTSMTIPK